MCYNQTGDISTLEGTPLKLVDKFTYLGSSVESTEKDIETKLTKAWTAINRLSTIWKSDLTDKMKRSFFQAAVTWILLYGCTTWTLTKRLEKKLDGNYTRMLRAILNKSWQQHPTRHQLYGHLPPITKTIQVRRTRHAGHCWRSRDELIRDVLLWIPTHGRAKAGRPARTYIQQLCEDTGCCPEDLLRAMNDREEWRERVRDIRAASTIWWWWWLKNQDVHIFIIPSCFTYEYVDIAFSLSCRVFAYGLGDRGSILGRVIPKTQKVFLDTSLLNTQYYKVRFNGKVEQSRDRSSTLLYTSVFKLLKRKLSTTVANFTYMDLSINFRGLLFNEDIAQ